MRLKRTRILFYGQQFIQISKESCKFDYIEIVDDTLKQTGQSREFYRREDGLIRLDTAHTIYEKAIPRFFNNFQYGEQRIDSLLVQYDTLLQNGLREYKVINTYNYEGFGKILSPLGDTFWVEFISSLLS